MTGPAFRPARPDELGDAIRRAELSFGLAEDPDALEQRTRDAVEREELWVLADDDAGAAVAQARLRTVDHWFGGGLVACQHTSGVAVAPEHRGAGAASALLHAAVDRGARGGLGLSVLFPASGALYRKLGYEHAGTYTSWSADPRRLPGDGPSMRAATGADWDAIAACHGRAGPTTNGIERHDERRWRWLRDRAPFAYVRDAPGGEVDAYALFTHDRRAGDWQYTLKFLDWAATSPAGLQAVIALAGRHGTIGTRVKFHAPTPNPWALLVPEQDLRREGDFDWMARGLDLPVAIAARGFPASVTASLTIAVADDAVRAPRGPWRLEVTGGRGCLEALDGSGADGGADVRLAARAVGPLFTGYRAPADLARAGFLAGPPRALEALGAAFAGPLPTLLHIF